jgi:hypothetical protein
MNAVIEILAKTAVFLELKMVSNFLRNDCAVLIQRSTNCLERVLSGQTSMSRAADWIKINGYD